jgi:hypothetical protein
MLNAADFALRVACGVLRLAYSTTRITSMVQVPWICARCTRYISLVTPLPPRAARGGCSALVTLNHCAATICRQHGTG